MLKKYADLYMKIRNLSLDNNIFLAPMAGISDLPYRLIMKAAGAGLVYSEMISAVGLVRGGGERNKTRDLLHSLPEEQPLAIQLFGIDPDILAEAARIVANGAAMIDINMGCPVPKVVKSGAGSALMRDPLRIGRIVEAVRSAWDGPLTVKIRAGWDSSSINFLAIGQIVEKAGADAVTLHPRTRSQGFSGQADWVQIRHLKEKLSIPVIGSGDIFSAADGLRMLNETGCDAIMIGRGGYGNPWLIAELTAHQLNRAWRPPTLAERGETCLRHLDLCLDIYGERKTLNDMRKHLCWYARGVEGAAHYRQAVTRCEEIRQLRHLTRAFFLAQEDVV